MRDYFVLMAVSILYSCSGKHYCEKIAVDRDLLDSVTKRADTNYIKRYRNKEFSTAEYYINRKDKTVCQVMKDTAGQIRQIIITKKDTKLFTAEFYSNGQLKAHLPLDTSGMLDGNGEFYFENGCVKSKGMFHRGFYFGTWEHYNEKGKNVSSDQYDSSGQLIKTTSSH